MTVTSQQMLYDQELCASLRKGDQAALSTLYTRHAHVLFGLISGITKNSKAAESVLKETFLKIWNTADRFDDSKTSPLYWMIRIARESACLVAHSTNHEPQTPTELQPPGILKEAKPLTETYPLLTSSEKEVLDMVYLKGFSCAEAALQLKLPLQTVSDNLRMAVTHLKTTQNA